MSDRKKNTKGMWRLILFCLFLTGCIENLPPEYSIEIEPEESSFSTVFTGSSIMMIADYYVNVNDELIFGPVLYEDDEQITWTSSNPSYATITRTSSTHARISGLKQGMVTVSAQFGLSTSTFTIRIINNTEKVLTSGEAWRDFPVFSPDGTMIAYSRNGKICLVQAGNTIGYETVLTSNSQHARDLCWSPDGQKIVFLANIESNYNAYLYVVDVASYTVENLVSLPGVSPQWSPDGQTIAFFHDSRIYTVSAVGGNETALTQYKGVYGYNPSLRWSEDGSKIVYNYGDKLYIVNVLNKSEILIAENSADDWGGREYPQWSFDECKIIYVKYGDELYSISPAGGQENLILHSPANFMGKPAVSPKEPYVVFYDVSSHFMAVSLDGTVLFRLNNDIMENAYWMKAYENPSWSHDGKKITFSRYMSQDYAQICSMNFPEF